MVPTLTVTRAGSNTKLSITTATPLFCAASGDSRQATAAPAAKAISAILRIGSALQRRVDDGEALVAALECHGADAEQRAKLVVGNLHRTGRRGAARRRLRERCRTGSVKRHVALDLLHHLMNVTVEHGDGAEALQHLQRAGAIFGAPAPGLVHHPKRDVGEQHDRCRGGLALEIVGEPLELVLAEAAHAAGLEVLDVDEADEVHAAGVEAVPAVALRAAAIAILIELDLFVENVVLAGHIMHVEPGLRDD